MDCDCSDLVAGVHHTVPTTDESGVGLNVYNVESCDLCERFDSDLVAAGALRDFLGGGAVMYFDDLEDHVRGEGEGITAREWLGDADAILASETSPWIVNAPIPEGAR